MLQQTRVETATPYYERFLQVFPTVRDLARADEDRVLALWSGLGYYTRARNLRAGAQAIESRHDGRFPDRMDHALALPGVGPYTAAAVVSIAYDGPHAVVDGNVARVLTRWRRLDSPDDRPARLQALAQQFLSPERPGDFNQAMMELGATVCTPVSPTCPTCPVAEWCRARADQVVDLYPPPRRRPDPVDVGGTIVLARDERGRLLLERGRWRWLGSVWLPPILGAPITGAPQSSTSLVRGDQLGEALGGALGEALASSGRSRLARALRPASVAWLGQVRHTITHHRLRLEVVRVEVLGGELEREEVEREESERDNAERDDYASVRWVDGAEIEDVARSGLVMKALRLEAQVPARKQMQKQLEQLELPR